MSDIPAPATFQPVLFDGGPLAGKTLSLPETALGVLAADRASNACWVYQRDTDGVMRVVTDPDPSLVDETGERLLDWARLEKFDRIPVVSVSREVETVDEPPMPVPR